MLPVLPAIRRASAGKGAMMENSEKEVSILIVEDDKYISNFICMSLKQEGYHYLKADTGREAIGLSLSLIHI